MRLAFYDKDHERYSPEYNMKLNWDELGIVTKKLCRHFKCRAWIEYSGHRNGGCANKYGKIILGKYGRNFGTLCHEFGHIIEFKKFGESHHRKRLAKIIARVVNYCRKKNYWKEELERISNAQIEASKKAFEKRHVEEHKPAPVKALDKIGKRNADIARYEKRLAYYTKLYSNKIKKARRSIAILERYARKPVELPAIDVAIEGAIAYAGQA
jgi:hypothetical protein